MVLFEKEYNKKLAFNFLNTVKLNLLRTYSIPQLSSLRAKGIPEFKVSIEKTVAGFDSQYNDKLLTIKSEVRDLEQQMHINLDLLFKRNEKMDSLLDNIEQLEDNSYKIRNKVGAVRF